MSSKYVLTYELKILYCPDVQLNLTCKELNLSSLQFTLFDGNRKDLDTGYEINAGEINQITSSILLGEIGYELSKEQMNWIIKYENLLKKDISLLLDKRMAYNYFILKLRLLGFTEPIAKDIIENYYRNLDFGKKVQHPQIFLKNINKFLDKKKLWVKNDMEKERIREYNFMQKVILDKFQKGYKFSFDKFKNEYMNICKNGILKEIILFNQTPSYLINKKYSTTELVPYIIEVYSTILIQQIEDIYALHGFIPMKTFIEDLTNKIIVEARQYISLNFSE